jgi:hypothetical protein
VFPQQGGTVPTLEELCEGSDLIVLAHVLSTAPIVSLDRLVKRTPEDLELGIEYELKVDKVVKVNRKKAAPGTIKLVFELGSAHSSYLIAKGRNYLFFLNKKALNEEKYSSVIVGRTSKGIDIPENAFNISEYYKPVEGDWGIVGNKHRIRELVDQINSTRGCLLASNRKIDRKGNL